MRHTEVTECTLFNLLKILSSAEELDNRLEEVKLVFSSEIQDDDIPLYIRRHYVKARDEIRKFNKTISQDPHLQAEITTLLIQLYKEIVAWNSIELYIRRQDMLMKKM